MGETVFRNSSARGVKQGLSPKGERAAHCYTPATTVSGPGMTTDEMRRSADFLDVVN
jgi:hypothetical protein